MQLSVRLGIEKAIVPFEDDAAGAIVPGYWIDMKKYHHAMFIIDVNSAGANVTAAKVQQADDAIGSVPVDVAGLTANVAGSTAHGQNEIAFSAADINAADPTKQFVGIHLTTTNAGDDVGGVFIGFPQRYT